MAINELILDDNQQEDNYKFLRSIDRIGEIMAFAILSYLPEIGELSNKQLAALVGVASYEKESGNKFKKKRIYGGRYTLRQILYRATLSAIKYNVFIKNYYEKLSSRGKLFKVAIVLDFAQKGILVRIECYSLLDFRLN